MLSVRLKTIADMVPDHVTVYDIGCDHGLLDLYLAQERKGIKVYAVEKNEVTIQKALHNFKRYQGKQLIPIISDGLEQLTVGTDDILVLAGMGTSTILHILRGHSLPDRIIVDAHRDLPHLRKQMVKLGYMIMKEQLVYENGYYYVIILFYKGKASYHEQELFIGPLLLKERSSLFLNYIQTLYQIYQKKYQMIPDIEKRRKEEVLKYLSYLEDVQV